MQLHRTRYLPFLAFLLACSGRPVVGGDLDSGPTNDLADESADAADAHDVSDAPGDVAPDVTDVADASDVTGVTDVSDVADVADVIDAADVPDGPFLCRSDADCTTSVVGRVCDTTSGRCLACLPSRDTCPVGQYCVDSTRTCAPGCRDDSACAAPDGGVVDGGRATPRCLVAMHACVECVSDEQCAAGSLCAGNVCAPGCNPSRACPTGQACCMSACVDTVANVANCGACDRRCTVPNATAACVRSACAVGACTAPFGDCDANATNGCETDTTASASHCGACGNACPARANAASTCARGACGFTCSAGFADCDLTAANGCEVDTRVSAASCGACGRACAPANAMGACAASACTVASCNTGFGDCDHTAANGCEVDLRTSSANCGACGTACGAGTVCVAGACAHDVTVTGCGRTEGGSASGDNRMGRFCQMRGPLAVLSGAMVDSGSTLTLSVPPLPSGARVVKAFLYRQTYDTTTTLWSTWSLGGTSLSLNTRQVALVPTPSPSETVRVEITDVISAIPAGGGTTSLSLVVAPRTSSGGFGWWIVYSLPSLPERTVAVFDGEHTDVRPGNGAITFSRFTVGPTPVSAEVHLYGGGDNATDAPSSAFFRTPLGVMTFNDVTDSLVPGCCARTQVFNPSPLLAPDQDFAVLDFTLHNYSAVSFALLSVNTVPPGAACSPACDADSYCLAGRCVSGLGCANGPRRGFTDATAFPNLAACGARLAYADAVSNAAVTCATGWRMCTPADLNTTTGPTPDFAVTGSQAWLSYTDTATTSFGVYPVSACGGVTMAVSNLQGTAACTAGGVFPEGWRLAVRADTWALSHQTTAGCVAHASHFCTTPGGSVTQSTGHTLCCRM